MAVNTAQVGAVESIVAPWRGMHFFVVILIMLPTVEWEVNQDACNIMMPVGRDLSNL
jgi:hypothetical protein